MKVRGRYLFVVIAMCGLIATSLGVLTNVAGVFFAPVAEAFDAGMGQVSLTLTICNLSYAAAGMLVPHILKDKNFKVMLIVGTGVIAAATGAMAFAVNVWMLYVLNILRGFAGGILGMVLVTITINNWFVEKNGLVTSIVMACSGLTGMAMSPVVSAVITRAGFRVGYLFTAGLILVFNMPAILLPIALHPKQCGMAPLGGYGIETEQIENNEKDHVDRLLFMFLLIFGTFSSFATVLPQFFPGIAASRGMQASVGAAMLSVCMAVNTGGKALLGVMIDRIGAKVSMLIYDVVILIALILLYLTNAPMLMVGGAGLFGLGYGLTIVGGVMFTKDIFGAENYGRVYPKVSLAVTLANAIGSFLVGMIYDSAGSYDPTLWLIFGMLSMVFCLIIAAYRRKAAFVRYSERI